MREELAELREATRKMEEQNRLYASGYRFIMQVEWLRCRSTAPARGKRWTVSWRRAPTLSRVCREPMEFACRIVQNYEGKFEADRHEMAQVQRPPIHTQFMRVSTHAWAVDGAAQTLAKPPRGPQHTAIRWLCVFVSHRRVVARPVGPPGGRVQYITMNEKVHELQREVRAAASGRPHSRYRTHRTAACLPAGHSGHNATMNDGAEPTVCCRWSSCGSSRPSGST
jgi:hypothetical protein